MIRGIILSAGKQKRFEGNTYKSLVKIGNKTLLEKNIDVMLKNVDEIDIVIDKEMDSSEFEKISKKYKKVYVEYIESGHGCGHALLQYFNEIKIKKDDFSFLIWGDSIQDQDHYYKLCKRQLGSLIIPLYNTKNPYVEFEINDYDEILSVKFSKYGEKINDEGLQDLSMFYFNNAIIYELLRTIKPRNGEISFLELCNSYRIGNSIIIPSGKKNSFNTTKEYKELIRVNNF